MMTWNHYQPSIPNEVHPSNNPAIKLSVPDELSAQCQKEELASNMAQSTQRNATTSAPLPSIQSNDQQKSTILEVSPKSPHSLIASKQIPSSATVVSSKEPAINDRQNIAADLISDILDAKANEVRSKPSKQPIELKKVLVVMICVAEYKQTKCNLPGAKLDKLRLLHIFKEIYKYDIIMNKKPYVTNDDVEGILFEARKMFKDEQRKYKSIIVCYSGHGNQDNLLLSNYNIGTGEGFYSRSDFEQYFNGYKIPHKSECFKIYFVDSCRGYEDSELIGVNCGKNNTKLASKAIDDDYKCNVNNGHGKHPEINKCIMYSNMQNYKSYEAPYNPDTDDIAWNRINDNDDDGKDEQYCGIFMNSIYHTFKDNAEEKFEDNFCTLQDKMRIKSNVRDHSDKCKVGLSINESGNLMNSVKARLFFRCNDSKRKTIYESRINLLNKVAEMFQSNIQYA